MESGENEFETSHAPLPPHERTWRHPSEVASWNSVVQQNLASPPPLSRRLALFTTTVSIALALAIIVIAVPRGVGTETASDTTTVVTEGAALSGNTTATTRTRNKLVATPAVRVSASGVYVTAIDELPSDHKVGDDVDIVFNTNDRATVTITATDTTTGLAVLSVGKVATASASTSASSSVTNSSTQLLPNSIVIIEVATGKQHEASIGVSMGGDSRVIPLDGARTLAGLGVVRDNDGNLVGVALRHHHATKLVPSESIDSLVASLLSTSAAP
ncbi:MAG: hypothetical protein LW606_01340 [Ilumatobacteraceae bacterium]|nr:hypothetical protein [Ilumatobacteraceae bacterium]